MNWIDPRDKIWGFHVHQELPARDFPTGLKTQQACADFLKENQVVIHKEDALSPGYGPHLNYLWELRIESGKDILEKMGLAISFMAINRFGLSAYVHPLMHNPKQNEFGLLREEGLTNQANVLWFTEKVNQNKDYFFNPPRTKSGKLIDTRSRRVLSFAEKNKWLALDTKKMEKFHDPFKKIKYGYHIHLDFTPQESEVALEIYDGFLAFLIAINLIPTSTRLYGKKENGPHVSSGWEVKFETLDKTIISQIGLAIGWLMCNRQGLSIYTHPVTWDAGDYKEELNAHEKYAMFIGELPPLELDFFRNEIRVQGVKKEFSP